MLRNVAIMVSFLLLIGTGITYTILRDPERAIFALVEDALQQIAPQAANLDAKYLSSQSLPNGKFSRALAYQNSAGQESQLALQVNISAQMITLQFGAADSPVANQSIILRPVIKNKKVVWQCLDGSLLIRFRPKACRLGQGIDLSDYN